MIEYNTDTYRLDSNRFGHYLLTRKSDGASVYLQTESECEEFDRLTETPVSDETFDWFASEYESVMDTAE